MGKKDDSIFSFNFVGSLATMKGRWCFPLMIRRFSDSAAPSPGWMRRETFQVQ